MADFANGFARFGTVVVPPVENTERFVRRIDVVIARLLAELT